jgi:hypothetical protein
MNYIDLIIIIIDVWYRGSVSSIFMVSPDFTFSTVMNFIKINKRSRLRSHTAQMRRH